MFSYCKDKRSSLVSHPTKRYPRTLRTNRTKIAIHHSLTRTGSAEAFARYHVQTNKWPGIAYHFVINKDGSIDWCNDIEVVCYHVGNSNRVAIGINMVGDFRHEDPTDDQLKSAIKLTKDLQKLLPWIKDSDVQGHSEFPGYKWKACPVIDMNSFRSLLKGENAIMFKHENSIPNTYTVQRGDSLWNIAQSLPGISMQDLIIRNPGINPNSLRVGQIINLK